MNPQIFGPPTWIWLFYLALLADTVEKRQLLANTLRLLQVLLPCGQCRQHLSQNMRIYNPLLYMSTTQNFFHYIALLKLLADRNKPNYIVPSTESIRKQYASIKDDVFVTNLWQSLYLLAQECQDNNSLEELIIHLSVLIPYKNMERRIDRFMRLNSIDDFQTPAEYIKSMHNFVES